MRIHRLRSHLSKMSHGAGHGLKCAELASGVTLQHVHTRTAQSRNSISTSGMVKEEDRLHPTLHALHFTSGMATPPPKVEYCLALSRYGF